MIGLRFSYLQGAGFQNIPLLLSEVQSCQVGSPWSISGVSKTQLRVPHPSPLHTWANSGLVCSGWDGNWGGDHIQYRLKALILGRRACKMV